MRDDERNNFCYDDAGLPTYFQKLISIYVHVEF